MRNEFRAWADTWSGSVMGRESNRNAAALT